MQFKFRHVRRIILIAIILIVVFISVDWYLTRLSNNRKVARYNAEVWKYFQEMSDRDKDEQEAKQSLNQIPKRQSEVFLKNSPDFAISIHDDFMTIADSFFRYLEHKDARCSEDLRLGGQHDGGWNVCLSPPFSLVPPCVVFSFGIGDNWHFDGAISKLYRCQVLAFDPSIDKPAGMENPLIKFKKIGLGAKTGMNEKGWKMKTLADHLRDEGYWGVPVDYVKIDIELDEWDVLRQAFRDEALKYVKQFGFEMHTERLIGRNKSQSDEKLELFHKFKVLQQVQILGFRKFNYRKNPFGNYKIQGRKEASCCYELHFINSEFLSETSLQKDGTVD